MRDAAPSGWQRWRIAVADRPNATPPTGRFGRARPADLPDGSPEQPGPDGIRHELVARVRREIEAGLYDTEEKWLAAEAALLRRIEERM